MMIDSKFSVGHGVKVLVSSAMLFSTGMSPLAAKPAAGQAAHVTVTSGPDGAHTNDPAVIKNLDVFDTLDFDVYTNKKWDRMGESHAADIVVTWGDGHETHGLPQHIEDAKAFISFVPDARVTAHTVKIAVGDWSSVSGTLEGTFTQPLHLPDGSSIPPTNKPFKIQMVTVAHWNKQGLMDHEWLLWDNASVTKQMGLSK